MQRDILVQYWQCTLRTVQYRYYMLPYVHSGGPFRGRDAPRFDAEMASWATSTHVAFMVHAAAAAAARAIARAVREFAKRRLIDHYLVEVADNTVVIPRPDISAFTA